MDSYQKLDFYQTVFFDMAHKIIGLCACVTKVCSSGETTKVIAEIVCDRS